MPRYARAFLAGYPHHIVQRGHDRQPAFAADRDCCLYLTNLAEQAERFQVSVIGYCLMTNHVHLRVQPEEDGADLSRLMRVLAARQTPLSKPLNGLKENFGGTGRICTVHEQLGGLIRGLAVANASPQTRTGFARSS